MRRRLLELTLMSALVFVVPSARAATRLQPADGEPGPRCPQSGLTPFTTWSSRKRSRSRRPGGFYGISAVALYEAVVPGTLHHRSLVVSCMI